MRLIAAVALAAWISGAGCAQQEGEPLCLDDCTLCASGECPEDRCGLLVILASDCVGKAPYAEVAVDQCLEEDELAPGTSIITCATVRKNETRTVTVRGEEWYWRKAVTCSPAKAGKLIPVALYCMAQDG